MQATLNMQLKDSEAALERKLGRSPTASELAAGMGMTAAQYRAEVDGSQPVDEVSAALEVELKKVEPDLPD